MGRPSTTIIGERMKFPVSFTLVFLSLSWANAIDFFAPQQQDFKVVSRPYNRTLLSGTVSISDQILDIVLLYKLLTLLNCTRGALVLSQLAVISVVPRSVLLSFPATKPGEPRCAVRQPTGEEIHPVEELQPVIH